MYKILINYGGMTSQDDNHKGMEIIVYHPEKSADGTHVSASSVFSANMLKELSESAIEALINSLIPSLEICIKEVNRRKELEKQ